jgi:hypothetical protein
MESCALRSETIFGSYGPLFSRASEIALAGNFPYWLDTVLGGFPLYQTPHFSATYPFYFFGLLNYGKALEVLYTLSYGTCFQTLILYLNLYVLLRVAGGRPCLAVRGYPRPGQRQHGSQRALDRDRGWLELVSVVSCRDDPLASGTTLVRKYRAIFTVRRSDVYCEPRATSNSSGVLLRNLFHCRCILAVAKGWRCCGREIKRTNNPSTASSA